MRIFLRLILRRVSIQKLNDVFRRAFVGDVLETQKLGAERIPVELLMDRMLRGGADSNTVFGIRDMQNWSVLLRTKV